MQEQTKTTGTTQSPTLGTLQYGVASLRLNALDRTRCDVILSRVGVRWQFCQSGLIGQNGRSLTKLRIFYYARLTWPYFTVALDDDCFCYSAPAGERSIAISLSVCLSARERISGTAGPIFTKFLCRSPVVVAQSSSGGVAICYVLPVLWMTSSVAVTGLLAMRGRLNV